MYFLLNMGIFHCHVSLPEGSWMGLFLDPPNFCWDHHLPLQKWWDYEHDKQTSKILQGMFTEGWALISPHLQTIMSEVKLDHFWLVKISKHLVKPPGHGSPGRLVVSRGFNRTMLSFSFLFSLFSQDFCWGLDMCKVCTEAVHSVALWTRVTLQVWTCVKSVPKQSIP